MIITNTNIAGRIIGGAFAAAVLFGAPVAAMTIAPAATAHADPVIINLDGLCANGTDTDCDGDGVSNETEQQVGRNPAVPEGPLTNLGGFKKNPIDKFLEGSTEQQSGGDPVTPEGPLTNLGGFKKNPVDKFLEGLGLGS